MGEEQFWLCFHTPGEIETPNRYRNRYGQLLEHAPFSQRDFHPPEELETFDESGEFPVTVRVRDGYQDYVLDRHPFDVVGWDGYVWPYTFNARRLRAARRALPPAAAGAPDLPGAELRDLHVRPADARLGPGGGPAALPPLEHPVRGGHVLRRRELRGAQGRGPSASSRCTRPGLPHGPQPGAVEKALGKQSTDELAVMWDTFKPLRLSTLWSEWTGRSTPTPGIRRRPANDAAATVTAR